MSRSGSRRVGLGAALLLCGGLWRAQGQGVEGASASPALSLAQPAKTLVTLPAASRFLDQASFGPTQSMVQHVQSVGFATYLKEQLNTPPTLLADVPAQPVVCTVIVPAPCLYSEWWQAVLTGQDQLRQRVAFALGEMFVVSNANLNSRAIIPYQNVLVNDAFGNFSTLLRDVTLSTGMGNYLNMLNSGAPGAGEIANENYAREVMQLFSIGLYELNQDGTAQVDSGGKLIATYTEAQVQAFARALTGWTYASASGGSAGSFPERTKNFDAPMMPVASAHDETAKTLLNGATLNAGQSAEDDLDGALANVFAQQNVGPFVCRQLIQHLVTSNPSPAYVERISAVFANNGSGVRGDLWAVVNAILLDAEARAGDANPSIEGGHLREPALYLANVMRALGFVNNDKIGYWGQLSEYTGDLGESPFGAGSVFNFFPPDYMIPGSTATSPEFALENTASAMVRLTIADKVVSNRLGGFTVDLSATSRLGVLAATPGMLVDTLGSMFMHGQMPEGMRMAIVDHVAALKDPAQRVRVAVYLVITSSLYKVEH